MRNIGEAGTAAHGFIVYESVADEFAAKMLGMTTAREQETNGLCDENRRQKLAVESIARIVKGTPCP